MKEFKIFIKTSALYVGQWHFRFNHVFICFSWASVLFWVQRFKWSLNWIQNSFSSQDEPGFLTHSQSSRYSQWMLLKSTPLWHLHLPSSSRSGWRKQIRASNFKPKVWTKCISIADKNSNFCFLNPPLLVHIIKLRRTAAEKTLLWFSLRWQSRHTGSLYLWPRPTPAAHKWPLRVSVEMIWCPTENRWPERDLKKKTTEVERTYWS